MSYRPAIDLNAKNGLSKKAMKDKVFLVTGAASGIGRATTIRLGELGAKGISISDLDEAGLLETKCLC